jgi:hypothetical protein
MTIHLSLDGRHWSSPRVDCHETPAFAAQHCNRLARELSEALNATDHGDPCWRIVRADCLGQFAEVRNPAMGAG